MGRELAWPARWLFLGPIGAGLLLTACPPTDDYRIRDTPAVGGSVSSGGGENGGSGAVAGTGGSAIAGASATSGAPGSGGADAGAAGTAGVSGMEGGETGSAGGGSTACPTECNAGRICDGGCQGGWVPTSVPPGGFSPRERAAYTSLGSQLFVWGGLNESGTALNSGALYDPRTDSWRVIATDANTPSPRSDATAVWTGAVVLVFGGIDPSGPTAFADGARYDPADDAWLPMPPGPTERVAPIGTFGQTLALFYGGTDQAGELVDGLDIYDVELDEWFTDDGFNSPSRRQDAAWGDGDRTLWISGGRLASGSPTDNISYYSFQATDWVSVDSTPLSPRWGGFGAFVAGEYHTWGGRDVEGLFADGVHNTGWWADMTNNEAPAARYASHRESGWAWAFSDANMVLLGGLAASSSYFIDGAIYDTSRDSWSAISAWPGGASHAFGAAGIAANEVVIWGGRNGNELTNEGARYLLIE